MNIKNIFKTTAVCVVALSLTIFSCSDDDEPVASTDTSEGEMSSEAEVLIEDAINVSNESADEVDSPTGRVQACNAATLNTSTKTITLDFGTDGCTGVDGRLRKGKITITYLGADIKTSTSRTLTFLAYNVNGNSLDGSISQTTLQRATATSFSFSISASDLTLKLSDGESYELSNFQRSFTYEYGAVGVLTDNVTTITGSSTQTSSLGTVTTLTITTPITFKGSCTTTGFYYPASGSYSFVSGALTYTINWGSGACDKDISITVGGRTVVKTLP
jgi:hypothetical protein